MHHPDDSPGIGRIISHDLGLDPALDSDADPLTDGILDQIDDDVLKADLHRHPEKYLPGETNPDRVQLEEH